MTTPAARLPVLIPTVIPSGEEASVTLADDDPRGTTMYVTTAWSATVILSPAQAACLAGELLHRHDDDLVDRMARAMYAADFPTLDIEWPETSTAMRDNYRELAYAAIHALRAS